jgi:hypothetical protein
MLYRNSIGTRTFVEHCEHSLANVYNNDILRDIVYTITKGVQEKNSVENICLVLVKEFQVIASLDFLKEYMNFVDIMITNMEFIRKECKCGGIWFTGHTCDCYDVHLNFL